MGLRRQAREAALQILYLADIAGLPGENAARIIFTGAEVPPKARSFAEELARGTLSHRAEIDGLIARVAQNWERFLIGGDRGGFQNDAGLAQGPRAARDRVAAALRDLGPGLGDVALRVCCFLEGIEAAEQHMGWAARSGKIVLRIALMRLRRHYEETYGKSGPLIG